MFDEVPDEHVPSTTSQARASYVVSPELHREPGIQTFQALEPLEDLPMTGGIRRPPLNDVGPVLTVFAGSSQELAAACQRIGERVSQPGRLAPGESIRAAIEPDDDLSTVGRRFD